jgi:hypothetical protein
MSNSTANTQTTNFLPVQATYEPLYPYDIITFIGPAGIPFYAPTNPNLDGVSITNSTINSTTIGLTTPAAGAFTTATAVNAPSGNLDLTNKLYVDSAIAGISWKQPVLAATTANITLTGAQTIDTVPVTAGDRVLVKNQTNQAQNGIYIVGTPWVRSEDANTWDELVSALVFVEEGTQNGSAWYCYVMQGGVLGTTSVTWSNFSIAGTYFAGTGLSLAANTFSITNTGVVAATYGSASAVPVFTVNAQGQLTSVTDTSIAIAASAITSGTIDSARISGSYTGITAVGTLSGLTVSSTINGSISGNAATATSATSATTATNLAGGNTGYLPYQSGVGTTTFLSPGSNGQVLTLAAGVPSWANPTSVGDVVGPASSTDNAITRFDGTTGKIIQNSTITLSDAGALENVNEINFDITPASVVGGAGSLSWNNNDNTKTLQLIGNNNVELKLTQESYYRVKASSAITKGNAVMLTGTLGSSGGLLGAPATGLTAATGYYVLGIAKESAALNGWIYVQSFGEVKGIDTSGTPVSETWVDGDVLYYNPAVTGGLTKNVPNAPNAKVQVAAVVHADNTNGILFVRPTFEPTLNDLSNVYAPSPSNNDLITWDSTDNRWESRAASSVAVGTATNLAGGATGSLPYQSGAGVTTFLAAGTNGQVLKLASGVPTWSSDDSGVTIADDTTTATPLYPIFTSVTTGNATTVNVASTKLKFTPSTGTMESIVLKLNGTSSGYVGLQGAAAAGSTTYTLPSADGTTGQALVTDGSGTLSWASAGGSVSISNDTSTATDLYPAFLNATTGTASTIYTGNAKLLYKPSTGELKSEVPVAQNGIFVNAQTIDTSYTIASSFNGLSAGPVTVDTGVTVTVSSGSVWTVV